MRRMLAVAALAMGLFAAGCGGSDDNTAGGGTAPTTGAPATSAADTKAVCQSVEQTVSTGLMTVLSEVGKLVAAEAQNNQAEAERARTAAETAAAKLVSDVRAEAAKAQDPAVKSALESAATKFEALAKDVKSINEQKLQEAGAEITQLCG